MKRAFGWALLAAGGWVLGLASCALIPTYTDYHAMAKESSFVENKVLAEVKRSGNGAQWTREKFSAYIGRLEVASDTLRTGLALKEFSIKPSASGRWLEISFRDPDWSYILWNLQAQVVSTDLLGPVQDPQVVIRAGTIGVIGDRSNPRRALEDAVLARVRSDFKSVSEAAIADVGP